MDREYGQEAAEMSLIPSKLNTTDKGYDGFRIGFVSFILIAWLAVNFTDPVLACRFLNGLEAWQAQLVKIIPWSQGLFIYYPVKS